MAITYGLTPTGLVIKTISVIRDELTAAYRAIFGKSLDMSDGSIEGQFFGILAEREALIWELAEQVYNSQNPDAAFSQALDQICLLTGTFRPPATQSLVTLSLTGTPTTLVPAGSVAKTASTGSAFETGPADVTIVAATAWSQPTFFGLGSRVTHAGNVYSCTIAGTTTTGGPTSIDPTADITDGTAHWRFMGVGTGVVDVGATASLFGAINAVSGDISVIDTQIGGWNGVINLLDAVVGNDAMSDQNLRVLRESELAEDGSSPTPSIRAHLIDPALNPGVISVTVFTNTGDVTDANGLPPHSVECLVRGGDDATIRAIIYANVAGGIVTYGNPSGLVTGTIVDSQGQLQTINFSRPVELPIYVDITISYDNTLYPVDGDAKVKAAIATWGNAQKTGKDAVAAGIGAQAFVVPGVDDTNPIKIGTVPSPTTSITIPISLRQLATYDTSRITVHSTASTP